MTLKKFMVVFAFSMLLLVGGVTYMVVHARDTSTYQTFAFIIVFSLWIIFSIEYAGRLQRRARSKDGESAQG